MKHMMPDWSRHLEAVRACRLCPEMHPPPVAQPIGPVPSRTDGTPQLGRIYLRGQAPGIREQDQGRAFCGPAGRTLFRWFGSIGVEEERFRERVFMGAVARCYPGRIEGRQGDRRPAPGEIEACAGHFDAELQILQPELVVLVGRMAIEQLLPRTKLADTVGRTFPVERAGHPFTALPLPHPSGLNRWIQKDPGKSLLEQALALLADQPAWRETFGS